MSLYIDESYSLPRVNFNSSYVLSAVRIEPHDEISIRAIMMELKLPTEFKAHCRKSSSKRKNLLINSLADLSLANITVARLSTTSERTERQRRKALERLLFESTSPSAEKVVLESRGAGDDRKDIDFISMLRRNSKTDIMTEITHVRGRIEPLLWTADIVCGAVFAHLNGQSEYWEKLVTHSQSKLIEI